MSDGPVNFETFIGEYVTIRRPMPSSVPRGPYSTKLQTPTITLRIHENEKDMVTRAAQELGMTRSAFLVWCGARTAEQVLRRKADFEKEYGSKPSAT